MFKNCDFVFDIGNCRAVVGRKKIDLTTTECNLLTCLLERRGVVLSRAKLLSQLWGDTYQGTARTIDSHVQRLRRKLGSAGRPIRTIRGIGYTWD